MVGTSWRSGLEALLLVLAVEFCFFEEDEPSYSSTSPCRLRFLLEDESMMCRQTAWLDEKLLRMIAEAVSMVS